MNTSLTLSNATVNHGIREGSFGLSFVMVIRVDLHF